MTRIKASEGKGSQNNGIVVGYGRFTEKRGVNIKIHSRWKKPGQKGEAAVDMNGEELVLLPGSRLYLHPTGEKADNDFSVFAYPDEQEAS